MEFTFKEAVLTERWMKHCGKHLDGQSEIGSAFSFQQASVYQKSGLPFDGVILVTGPELAFHVFLNRGLTKVYLGKLGQVNDTHVPLKEGVERLRNMFDRYSYAQMVADFNPLAKGIIDFFRQKEEDKLKALIDH